MDVDLLTGTTANGNASSPADGLQRDLYVNSKPNAHNYRISRKFKTSEINNSPHINSQVHKYNKQIYRLSAQIF